MRGLARMATVVALAVIGASPLDGQSPDASQVLAAAHQALGGEAKLSAVKAFTATGRTRQLRGNNLVPIEFEIICELPDRFVRRDETPAQDSDPTTLGFNGDELIQFPTPPPGRGAPPGAGAVGPAGAGRGESPGPGRGGANPRVAGLKQEFARLMLGMFARSFSSYPVTFRYAAQAEAPEGKADVLEVVGAPNFQARLLVHRETHLPVMLMWQVPATAVVVRIVGQPPAGPVPPGAVIVDAPTPPASTASQAERDKYAADVTNLRKQALSQAKPVEHRMYYADFREADGLKLPFRIRRSVGGETIEETTFDRIRINPKIDPRKFEAKR